MLVITFFPDLPGFVSNESTAWYDQSLELAVWLTHLKEKEKKKKEKKEKEKEGKKKGGRGEKSRGLTQQITEISEEPLLQKST